MVAMAFIACFGGARAAAAPQQQHPLTAASDSGSSNELAEYRTLVSYAYYEGRTGGRENLEYYLQVGLLPKSHRHGGAITYGFVINGHYCSVPIPSDRPDVVVLRRENAGFDYGAHYDLLRHIAANGARPYRGEHDEPAPNA